MQSQEISGQKLQPDKNDPENDEEVKGSVDSIVRQIQELLTEYDFNTVAEVYEELEDLKERIQRLSYHPKKLQAAKDDLEQLENILQKHAQLVQPEIQRLLDELDLDKIDYSIDEKSRLEQIFFLLPITFFEHRSATQENIAAINKILKINQYLYPLPNSETQPQNEPEIQSNQQIEEEKIDPISPQNEPEIQSNQQIEEEKIDPISQIQPAKPSYQFEPSLLFVKEMEDAQNQVGFIKSAPDCFEKSVKYLIHIFYQKLNNKMTAHDKFIDVPTSRYNELINTHIYHIKKSFVQEVNENNEIKTNLESIYPLNEENIEQFESILTRLKQIQSLVCKFNFQEFFSYIEKADEVSKSLANCNSETFVLLLGTQGAGKSTTIHYLCGSEMQKTQVGCSNHIEFLRVVKQDLLDVKISPFSINETRQIRPIEINIQQGVLPSLITFIDTPGLFNNINAELDVSNQIGIFKSLQYVKSFTPIIVFSYRKLGARGENFKEILKFYSEMISYDYCIEHFNFFFTHVEKDVNIDYLRARIENILKELNVRERLNDGLVKFLEEIIKRANNNKLYIIDPLDKEQVPKILMDITKYGKIFNPEFIFQIEISEKSKDRIIDQLDLHSRTIVKCFKRGDQIRVDYLFSELQKFNQIMKSNLNQWHYEDYYCEQRFNYILKKLSTKTCKKYKEVVQIFQKQIQSGNKINNEVVSIYESNIKFLYSFEDIRQKYLCKIDGNPISTHSYQDLEKEIEKIIKDYYQKINDPKRSILSQDMKEFLKKIDFLADQKQIKIFVSLRNEIFQKELQFQRYQLVRASQLLGKIMNLDQNAINNEHQNQVFQQMSQLENQELEIHFEQENLSILPLDQFCHLIFELEKAQKYSLNSDLKSSINRLYDEIRSTLRNKFDKMNHYYFKEFQKFNLEKLDEIPNLTDEELNKYGIIQMNKQKVTFIQKYYQLLENFEIQTIQYNLNYDFLKIIKENRSRFNDQIIFWHSIKAEELLRKIYQDRKYSQIKEIVDEMMLVQDLTHCNGLKTQKIWIKSIVTKLFQEKMNQAAKQIGQIEEIFNQESVEEEKSKENLQVVYQNIAQFKDAISAIKDLKWVIENGNEGTFENLKEELEAKLQKLVVFIENNLNNSMGDAENIQNIEQIVQAFNQINEIQQIAQIINIEPPYINIEQFIAEIELNLNGVKMFLLTMIGMRNTDEEQKINKVSFQEQLKKPENKIFFTYYSNLNALQNQNSMTKKIDELIARNGQRARNLEKRVNELYDKLEDFVRGRMEERQHSYQIIQNLENKLGEGSYGCVYKIQEKKSQIIFAAKFLKLQSQYMTSLEKLSLQRELEIIKNCDHPLIIKYIEEFSYQEKICIVMQYASGGTLKKIMKDQKKFSIEELMNFLIMVLISLQYLQVNNIIHRDFNPNNILISLLPGGFKIFQLADFGLSKNANKFEIQSETLKNLTTKRYIAPEVVNGGASSTKVDMWALGIVLFELTTNQPPFVRETEKKLLEAITDDSPPGLPDSIPRFLKDIIYSLLEKNPKIRPEATKILSIPEVKEAAKRLNYQIREIDHQLADKIFEKPKKFE